MDFIDKILKCSDCGNDFVFTAGEQLFFHDKQFKNDPKRCKQCKIKLPLFTKFLITNCWTLLDHRPTANFTITEGRHYGVNPALF